VDHSDPGRHTEKAAIESRSDRVMTLRQTEEEAQAIVAHDGVYPVHGGVVGLEYYQKECRLTMILHFADFWAAAVEEEGRR